MKNILVVFGTRPEAIKMAPLVKCLNASNKFNVEVAVTAQHREMLDQVLDIFDIHPDFDLDLMKSNQDLPDIFSNIIQSFTKVIKDKNIDLVLVHGDTVTTSACSIACFFQKIPIGHVEAGLRTGNLLSPWPEEANRKITGVLSNLHFAPTNTARNNLLNEGIAEELIHVTGNTVIDALFMMSKKVSDTKLLSSLQKKYDYLSSKRKLVLITGHRRENFGKGFISICQAIKSLAKRNTNVDFVYPVHLNPNVSDPVNRILANHPNIFLIDPLEYTDFVYLLKQSYLVLTDSGGIQEEAPSFGKPVLVMRDTTERPEAVEAGTVKLVGTNERKIKSSVQNLIDNSIEYEKMSKATNPYGDGTACKKIVKILEALHE